MEPELTTEARLKAAFDEVHGAREDLPPRVDLISAALDEALPTRQRQALPRKRRRKNSWPWVAGGFLAAAAAAAFAIWTLETASTQPASPRLVSVQDVDVPSEEFGGAEVERLEPSRLSWDEATRTLIVESGAVRVHVDPARHERYSVRTQNFVVEVTGTRFEVRPSGVQVLRGSVRVRDPEGKVLVESLKAGDTWQAPDDEAPVTQPQASSTRTGNLDPSLLLDQAAAHIAKNQPQKARALIQRALRARPNSAQKARAEVLLADCSQLEGKREQAETLYEKSSSHEQAAKQAQAALFSAARLAAQRGEKAKAKALFQKYLRDYPDGYLQREAVQRLRTLDD